MKNRTTIGDRVRLVVGMVALSLVASGCGLGVSMPFGKSHTARPAVTSSHRVVAYAASVRGMKKRLARARTRRAHANTFPLRRAYARSILPTLDRSARLFDRAVAAVSGAGSMDNLDNVCSLYLTEADMEQSYIDGLPHPFPWYSAAGTFHHQVLGVFHRMTGSIVACQTAVGATDQTGASIATADMARSAAELHRLDAYDHWLAVH